MNRFWTLILFLFLGQIKLAFTSSPIELTAIPILSPVVYAFQQQDSIYVVTSTGWLFPFSVTKGEKEAIFEKQDSVFLGLDDVEWVGSDGRELFLGNSEGLFQYDRKKGIRKIKSDSVYYITGNNDKIGVLFENEILVFEKGYLKRKISLEYPAYYLQFVNDSLLLWLSNKATILYNLNTEKFVRFDTQKYQALDYWKKFRGLYHFILPHFAIQSGDSLIFPLGYQTVNDSFYTTLIVYDLLNNKTAREMRIGGQLLGLQSISPYLIIQSCFDFEGGRQYIWNIRNDQFTFLELYHVMAFFPFYGNYVMISTLIEGYEIFQVNYPFVRYKNEFKFRLRFGFPQFQTDLNKDGKPDWVMVGASGLSDPNLRVYYVFFAVNQIDQARETSLSLIREAQQKNNFLECEKALFAVEQGLAITHFLIPESTAAFMSLREQIYKKVVQKRWIQQTTASIVSYLPFVVMVIIIFILFLLLRRKIDQNRSVPSAETLNFLQGEALFHKIVTTLDNLLTGIEQDQVEKIKSASEEIGMFIKYLRQKKVRYEFLEAPRLWRKFYRRLFLQLVLLHYIAQHYFWLKKLPVLGSILPKRLKQREKRLLQLKAQFKNMIEEVKTDVVSGALLPTIDEIQRKASRPDIIFRTRIQVDFPYRYFPDEILKFQQVFYSILENAIESFDDLGDCAERQRLVEITVNSSIDELNIIIQDHGKGMPANVLDKIFLPGFSYEKAGKERGYGLSGVKEFLNGYGELIVTSVPCEGTRFHIRLFFGKLPEAKRNDLHIR